MPQLWQHCAVYAALLGHAHHFVDQACATAKQQTLKTSDFSKPLHLTDPPPPSLVWQTRMPAKLAHMVTVAFVMQQQYRTEQ